MGQPGNPARLAALLGRGWVVAVLLIVVLGYGKVAFNWANDAVYPESELGMPDVVDLELAFTTDDFADVLEKWAAEPCRRTDRPDCTWVEGVGSVVYFGDGTDREHVILDPGVTQRIDNGAAAFKLRHLLLADMAFPALYGLAGMALIAWAWRAPRNSQAPWPWLLAAPAVAALLDYLENASLYAALSNVDGVADLGDIAGPFVVAAAVFAFTKFAMLFTSIAVFVWGVRGP